MVICDLCSRDAYRSNWSPSDCGYVIASNCRLWQWSTERCKQKTFYHIFLMMYKWNIYPQFGMFEHGVHSFWVVVIHYTSFAWWVHCSNGLDPWLHQQALLAAERLGRTEGWLQLLCGDMSQCLIEISYKQFFFSHISVWGPQTNWSGMPFPCRCYSYVSSCFPGRRFNRRTGRTCAVSGGFSWGLGVWKL